MTYEGNKEVKANKENSLNKKYEHFFTQKNELLTQTFNRFNFLINEVRRLIFSIHESA